MIVLAIDPGRGKCGIAVVKSEEGVLFHCVMPRGEAIAKVRELKSSYAPDALIVGKGTGGRRLAVEIENGLPGVPITLVDERFTTIDAVRRYYQENPPRGLRKLIPRGLLIPGVDVDDYAAIILAERFLRDAGSGQ